MIKIFSENKIAKEIISKAFIRSHGKFNITNNLNIYCFISPNEEEEKLIKSIILDKKSKVLVFGRLSPFLSNLLGLSLISKEINIDDLKYSHDKEEDTSNLYVNYNNHILNKNNSLSKRYFYRFDFTNEWNNLGYGAILTDKSIWSISQTLEVIDAEPLSYIYEKNQNVSVFSTVKDFEKSSVLYINREIGTIDGLDWSVVEYFLSKYRNDELPSMPLVVEIPNGFKSVVSSRLDCDQSIINSKPIIDLYKKYEINISLAITTGINIDKKDISFLNKFYKKNGDILSHTINHYYSWGENYSISYDEAINSKKWLDKNIKKLKSLKYAVSPFHSNKPYAVQSLADAGYKGFISGIIHNDPEFLVSTSGEIPFTNKKIVTHSQQCMLHGDCYHRRNNSIEVYKESFDNHYNAGKMFGYLDHPFGEYQYGWNDEKERLRVHEEFINYINSFENVKWMTCTDVLDFVLDKSNVKISIDKKDKLSLKRTSFNSKEKIRVNYKNEEYIC